ncbi:hypothetical protein QFZ55_008025 [Streptomyces luteogriseus]|uniref:hypothetical protein n=1 Tax=Streptomyces luteogriseus TaxID=68233 RepID=UPI0027863FF2|nr:hypothetical protein [Streptomyces luteogriseus]MDQ0718573.1 hypothetical protein [Streptomyces luteogriseus]
MELRLQIGDRIVEVLVDFGGMATYPEGELHPFLLGRDRHCDHVGGDQPQQGLHRGESNLVDTRDLAFFHAASCPAVAPSGQLRPPLGRRGNCAGTVAG